MHAVQRSPHHASRLPCQWMQRHQRRQHLVELPLSRHNHQVQTEMEEFRAPQLLSSAHSMSHQWPPALLHLQLPLPLLPSLLLPPLLWKMMMPQNLQQRQAMQPVKLEGCGTPAQHRLENLLA